MNLKFYGAMRFARAALPHMKSVGGGRIINVTNLGAKQPGANSMPTSVTRAAGIALTKAMSKDLAQYNILVNTVCIGLIKSGQHEHRFEGMQGQNPSLTLDQFYVERSQNVPLGRYGEGREAGDVICFLASDRASYLTGTSVNIDGGTSGVV
jgi:NAD(P)-dependent dehydrogenase (short-subunit alcohol dehydrogenase family)